MKNAIEIIKRLLKEEKITIDECFDLLELILEKQQNYIPIMTPSQSPSTIPWTPTIGDPVQTTHTIPWIPTIGDPVSITTITDTHTQSPNISWYPYGSPYPPQYTSITSNMTGTGK